MSAEAAATSRRTTSLLDHAKTITLEAIGASVQKYALTLEREQEILMRLADMMIEVFAMESVLLRTRKMGAREHMIAAKMCSVYVHQAMRRVEAAGREVFAAMGGAGFQSAAARLAGPHDEPELNAIQERRVIARRLLQAERYVTV